MKCPICAAWTTVLATRSRKADNIKMRRYECGNGHRITTAEMVVRIDQQKLARGNPRTKPASHGATT